MKSFTISSFKFGQDARREKLAMQPGTLVLCQDAHITQGGEIQKRKSFVNLGKITSNGDTFGLEVSENGLEVFGGAANADVTV